MRVEHTHAVHTHCFVEALSCYALCICGAGLLKQKQVCMQQLLTQAVVWISAFPFFDAGSSLLETGANNAFGVLLFFFRNA